MAFLILIGDNRIKVEAIAHYLDNIILVITILFDS